MVILDRVELRLRFSSWTWALSGLIFSKIWITFGDIFLELPSSWALAKVGWWDIEFSNSWSGAITSFFQKPGTYTGLVKEALFKFVGTGFGSYLGNSISFGISWADLCHMTCYTHMIACDLTLELFHIMLENLI